MAAYLQEVTEFASPPQHHISRSCNCKQSYAGPSLPWFATLTPSFWQEFAHMMACSVVLLHQAVTKVCLCPSVYEEPRSERVLKFRTAGFRTRGAVIVLPDSSLFRRQRKQHQEEGKSVPEATIADMRGMDCDLRDFRNTARDQLHRCDQSLHYHQNVMLTAGNTVDPVAQNACDIRQSPSALCK